MQQLNLFTKSKSLRIHDKWQTLLSMETINNAANDISTINCIRTTKDIFPDRKDVFRSLQIDPQEVKVVILGQDPYHNENANGLAFGCNKSLSPSLRQILISMNKDYKRSGEWNNITLKSLSHLPKQGVLLLNTILTVERGKPLSHERYKWKDFTKELLINFSTTYKNRVYMLWGSHAKKYKTLLNKNNLILTNTHPAFAARENRQWDCNHFKQANEYLKQHNKKPIQWL